MKRFVIILVGLALCLFLGLFAVYGLWLNRVRQAEQAFVQARLPEADSLFRSAWSAWELRFLPGQLVEDNRVRTALNLVQIGYARGRYEETLDFLKNEGALPALADRAEYHFWVGNLLMQRVLRGKSPAGLIEALGECREEYLESLRRNSELWDAKYNYEFVNLLLAQLQQGEGHQEPDIKLLLEHMRTDQQRRKKELPPQKRG